MNRTRAAVLAGALVFCACGGEDGEDGDNGADGIDGDSVEIQSLDEGDSNCPNGGTAFTVDGETSYACNGDTGPAGDAGPPGMDGTDGFVIVDTLSCLSSPTLPSGYAVTLQYVRHVFDNGYVFVQCSGQSQLTGDVASFLYADYQVGANTGGCVSASDGNNVVNGGFWTYETNTSTGRPRATFTDPSVTDNGAFWDFPAADCDTIGP